MNDPLIGRQLANFRIERVLGRGGMAQVYYGQDIKLQRPVAIKVIDARYRDKPSYAKRFVNEARVLAKWHHEHIIQIYYADDEDSLYYYAMEYIDGQDLASIISTYAMDGELLPVEDVLQIGYAIADALDYAHKQGVIHRDVKPSNILVSGSGRVVLGDFGLALDQADGSLGETFGTPNYISPEQASRSANAVPQSDLYSLGVILFEMLVGVVPFNDPSPTSVALQHITEPPPAPGSINPDISPEAEKVLLKALEKSPQDRYQTGKELMNALESTLTAKSTKAKLPLPPLPVGVPTIASRPRSKESVTQRVASTLVKSPAPYQVTDAPKSKGKKEQSDKGISKTRLLLLSLLFLATIGFAWTQGWFRSGAFSKIIPLQPAQPTLAILPVTVTLTVTNTYTLTAEPSRTSTPNLSPTFTEITSTLTSTITPTLQPSQTPSYTSVATNSPTATQTVIPTQSAGATFVPGQQLQNLLFTVYYNENSLYFHNQSNITRSISGFTFERLDDQGETLNFFGGWDWGLYYPNITPDRCMALELYLSPPFLRPSECRRPYLSKLSPLPDDNRIFWTTQPNSHEFRVLWQNEEIGRCQINTGVCEVFVPYYPP
jgi:serine/threonine protein kinase